MQNQSLIFLNLRGKQNYSAFSHACLFFSLNLAKWWLWLYEQSNSGTAELAWTPLIKSSIFPIQNPVFSGLIHSLLQHTKQSPTLQSLLLPCHGLSDPQTDYLLILERKPPAAVKHSGKAVLCFPSGLSNSVIFNTDLLLSWPQFSCNLYGLLYKLKLGIWLGKYDTNDFLSYLWFFMLRKSCWHPAVMVHHIYVISSGRLHKSVMWV